MRRSPILHLRALLCATLALLAAAACDDDGSSRPASDAGLEATSGPDAARPDGSLPDQGQPDGSPHDGSPHDGSPHDGSRDAAADATPGEAPLLAADCDPIGLRCGFPFPSDVYLRPDPSGRSPSGRSVQFGPATLPKTNGSRPIPVEAFHDLDGWSPASTAMTFMPGATAAGLATPDTIASTLEAASPTILLNAATGARVPHWVEVDASARDAGQRALLLRPAVLLDTSTRYIVAVRAVIDANGAALPATEVFAALRDGAPHDDPSVGSRRAHYDDLFGRLEAAGVARADLQIAWDFTTGSTASITGPMIAVRDAALAVVGPDGPEYTVTSVEDDPNEYISKRLILTTRVPAFLNATTFMAGDPVPHLMRDEAGVPQQNGWMDMDVLVQIPRVAFEGGDVPLGVLQNGHGLFGGKNEGRNGYLARMAADGYVTIAVDYFGFSDADTDLAAEALAVRPELVKGFVDRQVQGMVNQLLAMRMMIGRVARDGIAGPDGAVILPPGAIDPTLRFYRGDSQGGIMGGTYMSVSTDVTRGLLAEFGTPYSLLLNRSVDWPMYGSILAASYGDDRDVQLLLGVIQLHWDRTEPSGFVRHLATDPLPGTPPHRVLLNDALGDHQVTTRAAHVMARAIGAMLLRSDDPARPVLRDLFGIDQADAPLSVGSALVEYDFGLPPEPLENVPAAEGCDPHDRVRVLGPSIRQQDVFFRTGTFEWACDGVCDCDDAGDGAGEEDGCRESFEDECR